MACCEFAERQEKAKALGLQLVPTLCWECKELLWKAGGEPIPEWDEERIQKHRQGVKYAA